MKMNRRNVVAGLGTVVAGGGLALGSGAFSTAEASRELEVNVVTGTGIAADFVDIILNDVGTTDTVGVDDGSTTDPTALFPTSSTSDDYTNYTPDENDVSLMENDVTIVFGPADNELPPNSTVGYDGLITVVNEEGSEAQAFDVSFAIEDDTSGTPEPNIGFEWASDSNSTVDNNSSEDVDVDVNTGEENSTGTLTITITES